MPVSFKIIETGVVEASAKLYSMAEDAINLQEPLALMVLDMFEVEKKVFSSGGRRGGGSWKQLKPDTIKRKGSEKILRETDALYDSLTLPEAPFQILDVGLTTIRFGTDRPAAGVHQKGAPSAGIPARPFIKFTQGDAQRWNNILARHLMKAFL